VSPSTQRVFSIVGSSFASGDFIMTTNLALKVVESAGAPPAATGGSAMDGGSFAALLLAHRRSLLAYANMLSGDRAAADDLVQDTFERALRAGARFQAGTNLPAWLRRIMKNLFTDRCRERRRFVDIDDSDLMSLPGNNAVNNIDDDHPTEALLGRVTLDDVRSALADIAAPLREVFVLAHLQRRNYQSIAEMLQIPVSTVGTRLWRARVRLREVLTERIAAIS
jgi:RNA polymerase sigma-70 factor, ECF subfamily